jgi:outer membrane protein TolC
MRAVITLLIAIVALFAVDDRTKAQTPATPTTDEVLSLDRAITLALQNNREVRNARLETEKAQDSVDAFRTHRLPAFKTTSLLSKPLTSFDLTVARGSLGTFPATGPIPSQNTTISSSTRPTALLLGSVSQPLSQLWRINFNLKALAAGQQVSVAQLRAKQQDLIKNVKQAYYAILQTQGQFESAEHAIKLYQELNRVTGEYYAQQAVLKPDLLDVQTRLAKSEYDLLVLQNQLATQKEQFNNLLGRAAQSEFSVSSSLELAEFVMREADLVAARQRALTQRPELSEAHARIKQAEFDRRAKKSEYLPDVSLNFNYFSPFYFSDFLPKNVVHVGVLVEWDIFDWGRKKHELAAKTRTIEEANNNLLETENKIVIDVDSKYRKLQETAQLLRVTRLGQEAATANVEVVSNRYRVQASLLKDVLQAQTSLADANFQYQRALLGFWSAKAEFEKATGEDK